MLRDLFMIKVKKYTAVYSVNPYHHNILKGLTTAQTFTRSFLLELVPCQPNSPICYFISEPEVNFVCLPPKDLELKPGTKCYALGWGNTRAGKPPTFDNLQSLFDGLLLPFPSLFGSPFSMYGRRQWHRQIRPSTSSELQEVALPIISIKECRRHYGNINDELHICAGSKGKVIF